MAGIGFALDISEARDAEAALRSSEVSLREEQRRLREAEAIGHAGSWEWDIVNDVITWSEGLFALHRPQSDRVRGRLQPGRVPGASRRPGVWSTRPWRRCGATSLSGSATGSSGPATGRCDGSTRGGARCSKTGELVRLIGAVADVTDQVMAEAEVIQANAFQQAVIAASPDYTFISNLHTGTVRVRVA